MTEIPPPALLLQVFGMGLAPEAADRNSTPGLIELCKGKLCLFRRVNLVLFRDNQGSKVISHGQ